MSSWNLQVQHRCKRSTTIYLVESSILGRDTRGVKKDSGVLLAEIVHTKMVVREVLLELKKREHVEPYYDRR